MQRYEYKVVPAPKKAEKLRGVKATEDRFAQTLMQVMNALGRDGWEYVRADALPCEERVGLTGSKTTYQNMLVFRRMLTESAAQAPAAAAQLVASPVEPAPEGPRLGSPITAPGSAPAVGPVRPELAAE
jgi:hypothetical protein